jgi:hypothetical protein
VTAHLLAVTPPDALEYGEVMLRSMWIQHLAGHADSAAAALAKVPPRHAPAGIWLVRAARVMLESMNAHARAGETLLPMEVRTRGVSRWMYSRNSFE